MDIVDTDVICALHAQMIRKPGKNSLMGGGSISVTRTTTRKTFVAVGAKGMADWRIRNAQPAPVPWRKASSTACSATTLLVTK